MSMSLDQLPDDVLVEVLQHLPVDVVLTCRLVCRRLEDLTRHRDVWRRRSILKDSKPCLCAVLRLAPCLDSVICTGHSVAAFATSRCAVTFLVLALDEDFQAAEYTQVVRSQEELGRLKHVVVCHAGGALPTPGADALPTPGADALLNALVQSSRLQSLIFTGCAPSSDRPVDSEPPTSSLSIFKCELTKASESFVLGVLLGHADTLALVDLGAGHDSWDAADLLANIPRLIRLKCGALYGLDALKACRMLGDVTLRVHADAYPHEAIKFLRQPNQRHTLAMEFHDDDDDGPLPYKGLIDALASSGRPLQRLSLTLLPELQPLIGVLPRLPALRQLLVSSPQSLAVFDELLLATTPATAPALRRLTLEGGEQGCGHAWLHRDAVKAALTANPSLHIHLRQPCVCPGDACEACATDCHQQAKWTLRDRLVLYAHAPDKCPSPEDHAGDSKYPAIHIRIPCNSA